MSRRGLTDDDGIDSRTARACDDRDDVAVRGIRVKSLVAAGRRRHDGRMHQTRILLSSGLMLVPVGGGVWRLCERNAWSGDAAGVIAYVETTVNPDGFNVVGHSGAVGRRHVRTLDEIVAIVAEQRPRGAERPVPIPHFPPRRARSQRPLPPVTGRTAPET